MQEVGQDSGKLIIPFRLPIQRMKSRKAGHARLRLVGPRHAKLHRTRLLWLDFSSIQTIDTRRTAQKQLPNAYSVLLLVFESRTQQADKWMTFPVIRGGR